MKERDDEPPESDVLNSALAELYTYAGQFDKALHIYLRLKRGNPFQLIEKHKLFTNIRDNVLLLIRFDATQAIDLLIQHVNAIPVASVVEQLRKERPLLHQLRCAPSGPCASRVTLTLWRSGIWTRCFGAIQRLAQTFTSCRWRSTPSTTTRS